MLSRHLRERREEKSTCRKLRRAHDWSATELKMLHCEIMQAYYWACFVRKRVRDDCQKYVFVRQCL
jgi:hypothetical protein